jgi:hypothetical protein
MRRRTAHESSLDLLLDTICNMFGMIIFIAVLAAVLARAGGQQQIAEASAAAAVPPANETELESLLQSIAAMEANDDERFREPLQAASNELEQARAYADRLDVSIASLEQQLTNAAPAASIEDMKADIRSLEEELEALHAIHDIKLRTPRRRTLKGRVPVQVVLTGDRFYLVNDWSTWRQARDPIGNRCTFWSTWNPQAVDASRSVFEDFNTCGFRTGGLKIDREIHLLPTGGLSLDSPTSQAEVTELMSNLVRGKHVVSFRVTPDSFDRFHDARRLVVGQGIEYDVTPIPSLGDEMIFRDKIRVGTATGQ